MPIKQYFDYISTPIGILRLNATNEALIAIEFVLEQSFPQSNEILEHTKLQLNEYFDNPSYLFNLPIKPAGTGFQQEVWRELMNIPSGDVISYRTLAMRLGDVKKIRAVGSANGQNPLPIIIPCHRVIGSNGQLVGYSGGLWRKEWLLAHESKNQRQEQIKLF